MDEADCIDYRKTGFFSKLICDYVEQKKDLKELYHRFPTVENFKDQIEEKSNFSTENRKVLVEVLEEQYKRLNNPQATTKPSLANISLLKDNKTFTITTGHQLNIFTGPLYFIYKIVSVVNLCNELKQANPDCHFVPVYWMATEDHDFAEINHINIAEGRTSWNLDASGPVGKLSTDTFEAVIDSLEDILGAGSKAQELKELFKNSYLKHSNLADATRYLVHELLGDTGVVIVDADDSRLKKLMIPYFWEDLKNNLAQKATQRASTFLSKNYIEQVHIRPINLFYIKDSLRERIEYEEGKWSVLNTDLVWGEEELKKELEAYPERFSPNVVLRPLYQEVILPNLAYIGGGGELAYWLQLKEMFEAYKVPFPMLSLRNSALLVSSKQKEKANGLSLSIEDFFTPLEELLNRVVTENSNLDIGLTEQEKKLIQIFDELEEAAQLTDRSMLGAVNAQRYKQIHGLQNLKKKLLRAEKKRESQTVEKIRDLHHSLFPNGSLQERYDNFIPYYLELGPDLVGKLLSQLRPLDYRFSLIKA